MNTEQIRECNNCDWLGWAYDCVHPKHVESMLLCPECHETTEVVTPMEIKMNIDPNHDIVPTLKMFSGLMMSKAAEEIERLREREQELTELLRSAHCIANRKGENVAWDRFAASILKAGIGSVTARTYRVLPSD